MASNSSTVARPAAFRGVGRSILLTLPIALWSLLMFTPTLQHPGRDRIIGGIAVIVFMTALFFLMMRTGETYRWRRIFFVALGFLFPIGFIASLVAERGTMSIPISRMVSGDTPFCFMVTPSIILPAAFARTIIFPGAIMSTATNPRSIAIMIGLWFAFTLVLGKAWCSYACFFGGIEEGFAALPKRRRLHKFVTKYGSVLRLIPWAILVFVVLVSAAILEPVYCMWLCPFKAVTEFPAVRNVETAIQFGVFIALFVGLVVVLPLLTKKRTQCGFFCPFGAFQSLFNKINLFEIRFDRAKCVDCTLCQTSCPTVALSKESIREGKTLLNCMKCGACVDSCKKDAAVWHLKGTPVAVKPERARLLFLYGAWGLATMFGGTILAGSLAAIIGFLPWK
ncbi:MAG: 4Fe-4S binding protein [Terracidiphilus sp.]|jgi:polyferredoxin